MIKLQLSLPSDKVTLSSDSSRKWIFGCLLGRPRIRAHNKLSEAEKLLDLSQYIFLFTIHQSSSSNLHCKLKLRKVVSDLNLDMPSFLVNAYIKQHTFCS